jgi:hypothetical protein
VESLIEFYSKHNGSPKCPICGHYLNVSSDINHLYCNDFSFSTNIKGTLKYPGERMSFDIPGLSAMFFSEINLLEIVTGSIVGADRKEFSCTMSFSTVDELISYCKSLLLFI